MKRLVLFAALLLLLAAPLHATVVRIVVDDMIHPASEEFIARALDRAQQENASALLMELKTPGGLESSMRDIITRMLASRVPVIVWVAPSGSRAASAGFFILEAADIAAMAPGTNTGAAHPVIIGGQKIDEIMKQKLENDSAAFMRSYVSKRGRNVELAESAVRQSRSFTDQEALTNHLIDVDSPSQADLFRQLEGRTITRFDGSKTILHLLAQPVETMEPTLKEQLLSFIMNPNVAFILLALGALALWAEFNHPGAILPGVVGLISILLAVFALNILPTRFAAVALILAAFVLFALEAKFVSHGILGTGGVIALFLGGLFLVDGPVPEMRVHWITALSVSVPFGIIAVFLMTLAYRAFHGRVVTGSQGMIGEVGVAQTPLAPEGRVFVHGEIWNAVAAHDLPEGTRVVVRGIDGLQLRVDPET